MGLASCDLDEYNPSSESSENVFATEQGIEGLVNQMYYNFGGNTMDVKTPSSTSKVLATFGQTCLTNIPMACSSLVSLTFKVTVVR